MNLRDGAADKEGDRHISREDGPGKFGDGEDRKGVQGEEAGLEGTAQTFDGDTKGLEAILGILHDAGPGFGGVTGLKAIVVGHGEVTFWKEERPFRNMHW